MGLFTLPSGTSRSSTLGASAGDNETEAVTKKEVVWMVATWVKNIRKVAHATEPLLKTEMEGIFPCSISSHTSIDQLHIRLS